MARTRCVSGGSALSPRGTPTIPARFDAGRYRLSTDWALSGDQCRKGLAGIVAAGTDDHMRAAIASPCARVTSRSSTSSRWQAAPVDACRGRCRTRRPTSPDEVFAQSVGSFAPGPPWREPACLAELADRLGAGLDRGVLGDLELFTPTSAEGVLHASGAGSGLLALAEWGHGSGAGAGAVEPRGRWSDGR
jgi:hypothetical protein